MTSILNRNSMTTPRPRDIDYAAIAVRNAITEKFGRSSPLEGLEITAGEKTIVIRDGAHRREGTRDHLLAAVRSCESYASLWESVPGQGQF